VDVATTERVAEFVVAQHWTNGAAGPIDMFLLVKSNIGLLQLGLQFVHQVITA
jgi:hypothetical protein